MSNINLLDTIFYDYRVWDLVYCENSLEFFKADIQRDCYLKAARFITNTLFLKFKLNIGINIFPGVIINIESEKYSNSNLHKRRGMQWSSRMNLVKIFYKFTILPN